jgi:hypothetical protein
MYIQKQQFHDNPYINPETGKSITINGSTYKKLVKKYGRPKIVSENKISLDITFLPENDVVDSKIILAVDEINTLKNLYLSYKERFSSLLNSKFILNQLKVNYQLRENFVVNNFKDFMNFVGDIPPPKFSSSINLRMHPLLGETPCLPFDLIWKPHGKKFWLDKLSAIQTHSPNIKKTILGVQDVFPCLILSYSTQSGDHKWDSHTHKAIKRDYITPNIIFYQFVNKEYLSLPAQHKLQPDCGIRYYIRREYLKRERLAERRNYLFWDVDTL